MSLFSFVGGLLGGGAEKKAIKKATQAQTDAANKAIAEQQRQFDLTRSDFAPYLETGKEGLAGLGDLIGTNGADPQAAAITALQESPFYQSLFRNGEEAVLQNAAATGGIRGGNTQRGLADFGADTLSATIQQQLASLGGLAGMGLGATNSIGNFGANKANQVAQQYTNIGQAQASGALGIGGVNSRMWQSAGSFLDDAVSAIFGGITGGASMAGGGGGSFGFGGGT